MGLVFGVSIAYAVLLILDLYRERDAREFPELKLAIGALLFGVAVWIVGLRLYYRAVRARSFHPEGVFLSPHVIRLAEEHVVAAVKNSVTTYPYGDLFRVESGPMHVYVYVDAGFALYIPVRAFESAAAKDAFVKTLSDRIAAARPLRGSTG